MTSTGFRPRADVAERAVFEPGDDQARVLALPPTTSAAVIGAPGSGKTALAIELIVERVERDGFSTDEVLMLTPSRASATDARDRIALRLGRPTPGPLARTVNSLAFEIVREAAAASGGEPPRLLTGAEQDQIIAELIDGELADGAGLYWPENLGPEVRRLKGFRTELRDLMMRATELGVTPTRLASLGRPDWAAAATFIARYDAVKASYRGAHFDSAELAVEAAALVRDAPPPLVSRLRLVVLDDAQEATEATIILARELARRGITIVAFGDPDISTGAFRGAIPELLGGFGDFLEVANSATIELGTVYRSGGAVRRATADITGRIGTARTEGTRRGSSIEATAPDSIATGFVFTSRAEELAFIARRLRELHVHDGVPWSDMAVIVRTGVGAVSRALQSLEVQTAVSSARVDVRDDAAVRGLLLALELALGRRELDIAAANELLLGPIGGLDAIGLRRLRTALRHEEVAGGGDRGGDELVADALRHPAGLETITTRVARAAAAASASVRAATTEAADGASIEELLWGVWHRTGFEKSWLEQSLGTGAMADEANRHLDAVVALFAAAKRFVERSPSAAPTLFLDAWLGAELAEDTLAPRALTEAVTVATPTATIGREFRVVVVCGVQENVWPNLRIRGSLLGSTELAAAVSGLQHDSADRRRAVMHDELRLFAQAVSRARSEVVVTAVQSDDTLPSPFLRFFDHGHVDDLARHPLSLRGMVGHLRRELVARPNPAAASALAQLAAEGVPGAEPSSWYGLLEPSTEEPLVDLSAPDAVVKVSPSRMDSFEACPLHWLIDQVGGSTTNNAAGLGTIIHKVAEDAVDYSADALYTAVQQRWGELGFESEWQSEIEKERARDLTQRLSSYLRDFESAGGRLIGAEKRFELAIGPALLSGSIDRVEAFPNGTAVIVDLKTGRNEPKTDAGVAEHRQLAAYQLAFADGAIVGIPEDLELGGAKLVIVSEGTRTKDYADPGQPPFTEQQLDAFRELVSRDAEGMASNVFIAQIGTHCLDPWSFGSCRIHVIRAVSA